MEIEAEQLAYWYFRLNGFLNIPNFVIHPDAGSRQRTDVDVMGVRFPYRSELLTNSMRDDEVFVRCKDKAWLVLAEVKTSLCKLNGPWTDPSLQNMQRALRAVGVLPLHEIELASLALYEHGFYSTQLYYISLFCLGASENPALHERYPQVPQITWEHCKRFIYGRFFRYRRQKAAHNQWDNSGKGLWNCFANSSSVDEFINIVQVVSSSS